MPTPTASLAELLHPTRHPSDGRRGASGSPQQATGGSRDAEARARRREEDAALVRQVLGGDPGAFRTLLERYQKAVYWIAYDVLLDREEAHDVTQEAFIRVHAALERFDQRRDFANWLYRIARNLAIDAYRRRRRRPATTVEDLGPLGGDADDADALETRDDRQDLAQRVTTVLESLPVEYRLALTLREIHGMTPREIARVTDCTYPTARWRLHRGRALFRRAWEERFGVGLPFGEEA